MNMKCRDLSHYKTFKILKCRSKRTILVVVVPPLLTSRSVCAMYTTYVMILIPVVNCIEMSLILCYNYVHLVLPSVFVSTVEFFGAYNSSYFVCLLLVLLSGDIESNPGPGRPTQCSLNGLLVNARSIKNKVQQLHAILNLNSIDFVAITETWLNDSVETAEIFDSSYQVYRKDRSDRRGGGILLAFKNHLKVSSRYDLCSACEDHNEILVVDIICAKLGKIGLILCYRPPSDLSDSFMTNLKTTLYQCAEANLSHICLLGDLNMPRVDWARMAPLQMSQFNIKICYTF